MEKLKIFIIVVSLYYDDITQKTKFSNKNLWFFKITSLSSLLLCRWTNLQRLIMGSISKCDYDDYIPPAPQQHDHNDLVKELSGLLVSPINGLFIEKLEKNLLVIIIS